MRSPPFTSALERLLFWVEVVTRPVDDGYPANDESVRVEARTLYNLLHAKEAYDVRAWERCPRFTLCFSSGTRAINGECPLHRGDSCLFEYVQVAALNAS